ncbi:BON domain-containing protein [Chitinophaga sancti]|uniref:BON domain-containing protein n=1 Tax=Chitinophaga sancti TaxID=1004 RepID=UPI002A756527|nr:BON domain-containing protein [Chitinophaga sancti]WPQ61406.1 BON domain-containing protein [Chitinophaga sancti]
MKNYTDLQKDVQDAIKWEPLLSATEIGVIVKDGVVTLTGVVDNYTKKSEAEDAAKNVAGVMAVVEKIEVKFSSSYAPNDDNEIASEILNAFEWNWRVPNDNVKVKVEKGWVTLEGEFQWHYERTAANDAVKNLLGVTGVSNNIKIKSDLNAAIVKADIESALKLNWSIYENDIDVKVSGHKATLTGTVDSWCQKTEAGRITFNAPGVWSVDNELVVYYDYSLMDE